MPNTAMRRACAPPASRSAESRSLRGWTWRTQAEVGMPPGSRLPIEREAKRAYRESCFARPLVQQQLGAPVVKETAAILPNLLLHALALSGLACQSD